MFLILSSTLAYTSNERKTLSLCYPSVSLVPRTGPGAEVLSVCQMEAAMCLVMDGPGRKIEQDGAELTTRNTVKSRQRVGRKGFWNYLRYIRKWVCELIKKKKICVSILLWKEVHLHPFSRFHIHVLIYDLCPFSLSDLRGGGMNWEIRTDMYTLPCVKQTASGELLYSAWSSTACPSMT